MQKHTNKLINETSPYLLQHAHNPVDWHAWNPETLEKAKTQDKMLLISIGYSACHWCHVMEKESFEDETLAGIMNENFICVKVDREERPDVDAVYMNAVQLIHGTGGWPLNCFALPDGRPVYGGTYFKPQQWEVLLKNLADLYQNRRNELVEQASQILDGINQDNLIGAETDGNALYGDVLDKALLRWRKNFDLKHGGSAGAPKFPMPGSIQFLLQYAHTTADRELMDYVELTLDKMMMGGIYDQVGGGFSRYSVDAEWKVPHFEKMLYDNAQLINLYTIAYQVTGRNLYLETAKATADFVLRELTSAEGVFYAALDADSEGEEGKFYVWTTEEFDQCLGDDASLIKAFFEIENEAHWEHGKHVLMCKHHPETFAELKGLSVEDFTKRLTQAKQVLYGEREKRVRPGLDDKSLTSWNAMMIKALAGLSLVANDEKYLEAALRAADLIVARVVQPDGSIWRNYKNGQATIAGFLEDYAHFADAALELFQVTMDEKWLSLADQLAGYATEHFYDKKEKMFWFTSDSASDLVSRKKEVYDNVIPSSNAVMGHVLFKLSIITENAAYDEMARSMAAKTAGHVEQYAPSLYRWAQLMLELSGRFYEVVITGPEAGNYLNRMYAHAFPGKMVIASENSSELPVFKNRFVQGKTLIYVCHNRVCSKPAETVEKAQEQLA